MLFLLEYDREKGLLVNFTQFDDSQASAADDMRLELEISLNQQGIVREVVLLDAETEEDLRRTHRRYFASIKELTSNETAA